MKFPSLRLGAASRRAPFTISLLAAILVVTAVSGTLVHPISATRLAHWGVSPDDVVHGRVFALLISPFQVFRPYMVLSIVAITLVFLGGLESRLGTPRAALVWVLSHLVGYTVGSLVIVGLAHLGVKWADALVSLRDVGASNGAMGAAGALMIFLPRRAQWIAIWGMLAYLGASFGGAVHVWDVTHVAAFLFGLGAGSVMYRRESKEWPPLDPAIHLGRLDRRRLVAWIVATMGVIDVLTPFVAPDHPGFARFASLLPIDDPHWPRHLLFALGATMLLVAPPLSRGRRSAWIIAAAALIVSTAIQWRSGEPGIEHVIALIMIVGLAVWRRDFKTPGHRPSVRAGLRGMAGTFAVLVLYCAVGFYLLRQHFVPPFDARSAARETIARLVFEPQPPVQRHSAAAWFLDSIPLFGWGGLALAGLRLLRVTLAPPTTPDLAVAARAILEEHGASPTSYMTLWPGNSVFLTSDGECYVGYRVCEHVAIALGDPIGPPERIAAAARAFVQYAEDHGWTPVFFSASQEHLSAYEQLGLRALQIGEDSVIPLSRLEFRGKEWQNVRTATNRAAREGVSFHLIQGGTIPPEWRRQIDEISREWMGSKGLPELGFTLGRTEDVDDPNVEVALAVGANGRVHAMGDWLPVYGRREWVIDLMRRREDAMPGAMEFLIASSLIAFKERGYEAVSLAVAPLADVDRGDDAPLLPRVLGRIYERFDAYYQFKSLFDFKERFQPRWEPVFLVYRDPSRLPGIALAILRAHAPDLDAGRMVKFLGETLARRLFARGDDRAAPE